MRNRTEHHNPHSEPQVLTIRFKHEADRAGNKSEIQTYEIDSGEFALMVDNDRRARADALGVPVDEVESREAQEILDALWNEEERVNHDFHRGDRGPGKKRCTCGQNCGERRGCRLPETAPWSLNWMLEEDREPGDPGASAEDVAIANEDARPSHHQPRVDGCRHQRDEPAASAGREAHG